MNGHNQHEPRSAGIYPVLLIQLTLEYASATAPLVALITISVGPAPSHAAWKSAKLLLGTVAPLLNSSLIELASTMVASAVVAAVEVIIFLLVPVAVVALNAPYICGA